MTIKKYLEQKLAKKILILIFLSSFIITSLSIISMLFNQYLREINEIYINSELNIANNVNPITRSTWLLDLQGLERHLQKITQYSSISHASILDEDLSLLIEVGDNQRSYSKLIEHNLFYTDAAETTPVFVGKLKVRVNTEQAVNNVKLNLANLVITQLIKTLISFAIILFIIHHHLSKHLNTILNYIKYYFISNHSVEYLTLSRKPVDDELQVLVDTINNSKQHLKLNYQKINDQHNNLIKEIELRRQAEYDAKLYSDQLILTLNALTDAVLACLQDGRVLLANYQARKLLGLSIDFDLNHTTLDELLQFSQTTNRQQSLIDMKYLASDYRNAQKLDAFCWLLNTNTTCIPVQINIIPNLNFKTIEQQDKTGFLLILHDESNSTRLQELAYHAMHDFLTGLKNRFAFNEKLTAILAEQNTQPYCLAIIDLDKFKMVNDNYGHLVGDELLKSVATIIKNTTTTPDVVARLGGDEFAILFSGDMESSIKKSQSIIFHIENMSLAYEKKLFYVSCSIGITPIYENDTIETVQLRADKACYQVKKDGGGVIQTQYRIEQEEESPLQRFIVLQKIMESLREEKLVLYIQIFKSINQHQPMRLEVLCRLYDENNILLPKDFLPILDSYYYTPKLDLLVIKKLTATLPLLLESNFHININLSPLSIIKPSHTQEIIAFLSKYQFKKGQICFEITEQCIIQHKNHVLDFMSRARELGAIFALDDFGTGYASFGALHDFSFEILKIDGSLIEQIESNSRVLTFVKSIQSIAEALQATTVAEHVHSESAMQLLQEIGVDYVQSNLVGSAQALDGFTNKLLLAKPIKR